MKKNILFYTFTILLAVSINSCKSEFEKIRSSKDPKFILEKAFAYYDNEQYLKAQTLFELVIGSLRGQPQAEKVYFQYAYTHYYLKKYILASYYFKNFSNTYPNSEYREEADFMTGYSNYKLSPSFRLDQTYSLKAIEELQLFTNTHPNSERVAQANKIIDEIRKKLETKAYYQATLYFDLRQYQAAVHAFQNMLKDFPDTQQDEQIRFMIVKASYLLAENSIYSKKAERFEATLKAIQDFKSRYSSSGYNKQIREIKKNSNKVLKSLS